MNHTVQEIVDKLQQTGKCTIPGFGTFTIKVQKGREGVSAFNGKPYKTEDKNIVKFSASSSLDVSKFPTTR